MEFKLTVVCQIHRKLLKFSEQSFQATFTHFTWVLIQTKLNFNIALKAKDRIHHASGIGKKSMIIFNSNERFEQTSAFFYVWLQ